MPYLKRFSSLVALMPTLRAGFRLLMYKETLRNKAESNCNNIIIIYRCVYRESTVP